MISSMKNRTGMLLPAAVLSVLFALLVLCATLPVHAYAATGTLQIVSKQSAHAYTAYRLFACDVEGDDTLSNVTTSGCMPSGFYAEAFSASHAQQMAEEAAAGVKGDDASTYVVALSKKAIAYDSQVEAQSITTGVEATLESGLYLLTSKEAQPILVAVGGNPVTVNEKSVPPTLTKQVAAVTKGKAGSYGEGVVITSSCTVAFRVTGTLPSNYGSFDTYSYQIDDEPCEALAIDTSSIKVSLVDAEGTKTAIESGYTTTYKKHHLTVAFEDLKTAAPTASYGCQVVVSYQATLDAKTATYGLTSGNANAATLTYRNSPSYEGTGTTQTTTTQTYALKLDLQKHDADHAKKLLEGAEFSLKDASGKVLSTGTTDAQGLIEFTAVGTGTYYLEETKAPDGYDALAGSLKVTVSADADAGTLTASVSSDAAKVTKVDAAKGVVTISVGDDSSTTKSNKNNTTKSNGDGGTSGSSHFPQTGDYLLYLVYLIVGIAVIALVVMAVSRRKSKRD